MSVALSTIGLSMDILGFVCLYFFGLPSSAPDQGEGYVEDGSLTEQQNAERAKFEILSFLALVLIVLGFVLQIAANFAGHVH
ncbi:MAG: hypothetical protein JXQ85_05120 [Cognatishimia sp.]|uniref:hypothetical protein n=1 Tax=Cognatishimia sp. TaxID=2211648 RepID=UPI003B8DFF09